MSVYRKLVLVTIETANNTSRDGAPGRLYQLEIDSARSL